MAKGNVKKGLPTFLLYGIKLLKIITTNLKNFQSGKNEKKKTNQRHSYFDRLYVLLGGNLCKKKKNTTNIFDKIRDYMVHQIY